MRYKVGTITVEQIDNSVFVWSSDDRDTTTIKELADKYNYTVLDGEEESGMAVLSLDSYEETIAIVMYSILVPMRGVCND